jgi:hypothetical protein
MWVPVLVIGPHAILAGFLMWAWWPKSKKQWRWFGILMVYQLCFWGMLYFVFGFK